LIPALKELKAHVDAELWFNIIEDLQKIDQSTPFVQEHCNLSHPEPIVGTGNLTACIADAQLIVTSAEAIIANPSNIQADIAELETIFTTLKKAEVDCDFGAQSAVKPVPETAPMPVSTIALSSIVPSSVSNVQVSTIAVSSVVPVEIRTVEIVTIFEDIPSTLAVSSVIAIPSIVSSVLAIPSSVELSSVRTLEIVTIFEGVSSIPRIPSSVAVSSILNDEPSSLVEDRNTVRITIQLFLGDEQQPQVSTV